MICLNLQFDGIRRKSHRQNAIFKKFIMIPFFYKCQLFVMFFYFSYNKFACFNFTLTSTSTILSGIFMPLEIF